MSECKRCDYLLDLLCKFKESLVASLELVRSTGETSDMIIARNDELKSRLSKLQIAADAVIKLSEDIKNIVGFAENEGVADDEGAKIRLAIDALAAARVQA